MFVEHGILDANANVSCECFEWQNSDASEPGRYDAIFASDCLYDTTYYADLVGHLSRFIKHDGFVLIVYKMRHADREQEFFKMLVKEGFYVSILKDDIIDSSLPHLRG